MWGDYAKLEACVHMFYIVFHVWTWFNTLFAFIEGFTFEDAEGSGEKLWESMSGQEKQYQVHTSDQLNVI